MVALLGPSDLFWAAAWCYSDYRASASSYPEDSVIMPPGIKSRLSFQFYFRAVVDLEVSGYLEYRVNLPPQSRELEGKEGSWPLIDNDNDKDGAETGECITPLLS